MTAVTALTWVFALLLGVAGMRKITRPAATGAALQGARLPSDHRLVRLLGAGEVVVAAAVLAVGGAVPAAVLALAYAAFAVFAEQQRRRGAGCGCFGDSSAPASRLHVTVDAVGAAAAAAAIIRPAPPLLPTIADDLSAGLLAVALLALAAGVLQLLLTALPDLAAATALHAEADA